MACYSRHCSGCLAILPTGYVGDRCGTCLRLNPQPDPASSSVGPDGACGAEDGCSPEVSDVVATRPPLDRGGGLPSRRTFPVGATVTQADLVDGELDADLVEPDGAVAGRVFVKRGYARVESEDRPPPGVSFDPPLARRIRDEAVEDWRVDPARLALATSEPWGPFAPVVQDATADLVCLRCGGPVEWGESTCKPGALGYASCLVGAYTGDGSTKICGWRGRSRREADGSVTLVENTLIRPSTPSEVGEDTGAEGPSLEGLMDGVEMMPLEVL